MVKKNVKSSKKKKHSSSGGGGGGIGIMGGGGGTVHKLSTKFAEKYNAKNQKCRLRFHDYIPKQLYFIPLIILVLERVYIPMFRSTQNESSMYYMNVENQAITTKQKYDDSSMMLSTSSQQTTSAANNMSNQLSTFATNPFAPPPTGEGGDATSTTSSQQPPLTLPTLDELTLPSSSTRKGKSLLRRSSKNPDKSCPEGLLYLSNYVPKQKSTPSTSTTSSTSRKIPKIVHQTGKSRCVTRNFYNIASTWKYHKDMTKYENDIENVDIDTNENDWRYYYHDDESIYKLLVGEHSPILQNEFPILKQIVLNCGILENGTLKSDLWRYLILWLYGGIYADLDTKPNISTEDGFSFTTSIQPDDDGYFLVEQYHILSQYFIAIKPRHPLMYYAIQYSLLNLLELQDTLQVGAQYKTGPHVLHTAYREYRYDYDGMYKVEPILPGLKPIKAGTYRGTYNTTIRVVGIGEKQNQYIIRQAIPERKRQQDYTKMGITHFSKYTSYKNGKTSNITCINSILNYTLT